MLLIFKGEIARAVNSSGIAATLFTGGSIHLRFRFPLNLHLFHGHLQTFEIFLIAFATSIQNMRAPLKAQTRRPEAEDSEPIIAMHSMDLVLVII